MISDIQIRAARTMLFMTIAELAYHAEVATNTVLRVEKGQGVNPATLAAIVRELERFGISFIDDNGLIKRKGKADEEISLSRIDKCIWHIMDSSWKLKEDEATHIAVSIVEDIISEAKSLKIDDEIGFLDRHLFSKTYERLRELKPRSSDTPSSTD